MGEVAHRNYAGVPDVGSLPSLGIDEPPVQPTAPDGVPWLKCCEECMYGDRAVVEDLEADCAEVGAAFYCVHRKDGGHYRVCAGFAARDATPP